LSTLGHDPAVTIAVAMAVGVVAQSVARHLRIPGIVLLLAAGVLLGPDIAGIIQPDSIGHAMHTLVGFAVAVILFEGGMNLQLRRLRREQDTIRRLVTVGALITAVGGALAARLFLDWDWRASFLFGTLVIVTGPTVITPILRRIRVKQSLHTVLEAEGILIDAVGAIIAVFALEIALNPSARSFAQGTMDFMNRLAIGGVLGIAGGGLIAYVLRFRKVVPEGLENIFTLSIALAVFQISNAILGESGLVSVILAGMVVGNVRTRVQRDLLEFKEQLTILLIGLLFVLLAADIRLADVTHLGTPGVLTVLAVMLVVRPINVFLCTIGSGLALKEKIFLSWLAPRGIVAAAVASLFAETLEREGIPNGESLRALVFLVIAMTVLVQGLSSGMVAKLLGLRKRVGSGYVILGANPLSRYIAGALRRCGEEVVFIDSNPDATHAAQEDGYRVIFGNALEERTLLRAELDRFADAIAITQNEGVNLLFARNAREEFKVPRVHIAISRGQEGVTTELVHEAGATVLFGPHIDTELWAVRARRDLVRVESWRLVEPVEDRRGIEVPRSLVTIILPLVHRRGKRASLVDELARLERKDEVFFAILTEERDQAVGWLVEQGWEPLDRVAEEEGADAAVPAGKAPAAPASAETPGTEGSSGTMPTTASTGTGEARIRSDTAERRRGPEDRRDGVSDRRGGA
jgi:NhaP-type Na+/H+ or K+/H+ antiporter